MLVRSFVHRQGRIGFVLPILFFRDCSSLRRGTGARPSLAARCRIGWRAGAATRTCALVLAYAGGNYSGLQWQRTPIVGVRCMTRAYIAQARGRSC